MMPCFRTPPRRRLLYIMRYVSAYDMASGLRRSITLFETSMINAFKSCRLLHAVMLVVTIVLFLAYLWVIVR